MKDDVTYREAEPMEYPQLFNLLIAEAAEFVETAIRVLDSDQDRFYNMFTNNGKVMAIEYQRKLAGYYWIDEADDIFHLHALVLKPEFQNKGIGAHVLRVVEDGIGRHIKRIDVGFNASNNRARAFLERHGYETMQEIPETNYIFMQKSLDGTGERSSTK
jgi:ribosomal protein S18 acetylase RimI-like enzyme